MDLQRLWKGFQQEGRPAQIVLKLCETLRGQQV